jgi:glutamate-1-semialdehyde 2,1-aminomutase
LKDHQKSRELFERAKQSLAGGVSSHFRASERPHPLFYVRAQGSRIWDVDGNEYLDFTLAQGPMILGHSHPVVIDAVCRAIAEGQLFAGQHLGELELAESLKRLIPCAELARFSLSGSEAVHAAIRLARAFTGRPKFVKFEGHYHGWFDEVSFSVTPPVAEDADKCQPHPVPWTQGIGPGNDQNVIVLPWNNLKMLQEVLSRRANEIAAVICEPVMCNNGCIPPEPGYLEGLRDACNRHGIVLIFDEIITGFRLGLSGAQGYYKVVPDIAVFGKAMASGFPISAIVGRQKLMELFATGQVMHAGTLNAQNGSVAAALATIRELEAQSPEIYNRLAAMAQTLGSALIKSASRCGQSVVVQAVGPVFHLGFTKAGTIKDYRGTLTCDKEKYRRFCDAMHDRGIRLIGRGLWYVSAAHTSEDIEICAKTADAAFETLAEASLELKPLE